MLLVWMGTIPNPVVERHNWPELGVLEASPGWPRQGKVETQTMLTGQQEERGASQTQGDTESCPSPGAAHKQKGGINTFLYAVNRGSANCDLQATSGLPPVL